MKNSKPPLDQHDTTAILIERNGRFLLVRRANPPEQGFWAVPGGHRTAGETIRACAIRECQEEVGKGQIEKKPFIIFVHDVKVGHRHRAHVFRGTLVGEPRAGSDAAEARWFSFEEMHEIELTHYTKKILNAILYGEI
ncbi:MAG: NUDIX domain-containing protein [Candidatus Aenigmarchaeota archaeon]|nr:NUDIX domain-containing protein [Candidatus Aenigmarchaeota archaeon]